MTLSIRKTIVIGLIGIVFLIGNAMFVANWLTEKGAIDWAKSIRAEFLTGTAITVIIALLILLVGPKGSARRCGVCDKRMGRGSYCSDCGSRA